MKLTFPHMGNAYISVKVLLDELGLDYYMPAVANRASFEKGIQNSPEFMCLPFKTIIGNFIEGLDNGADVILFGGGCGQCRLSYFGDLQQEILRSLGYKFDYIHLNLIELSFSEVRNKLGPLLTGKGKLSITRAVTRTAWTIFAVDKLYALAAYVRCRELKKGMVDRVMKHFEQRVQRERGYHLTKQAIRQTMQEVKDIAIDKLFIPLKVGLIGEIFISSDAYTNIEIERKLGSLGLEVVNTLSPSAWIREHFINTMMPIKPKNKALEAAQQYMRTNDFGGHGIYTIGNAELFSQAGFDGIIQIYPFTCMPEIVAESAFSHIHQKYGVPIMTLIVDEMTGEAGFLTRLEAFADMLYMRREQAQIDAKLNLSNG